MIKSSKLVLGNWQPTVRGQHMVSQSPVYFQGFSTLFFNFVSSQSSLFSERYPSAAKSVASWTWPSAITLLTLCFSVLCIYLLGGFGRKRLLLRVYGKTTNTEYRSIQQGVCQGRVGVMASTSREFYDAQILQQLYNR